MNENHRSPRPIPGPYCATYDPLLALQSLGELEPERAAALRDHLATCAWCRERLREYTTVHAAMLGHFGRDVGPPPPLTLDDIVRAADAAADGADTLDIGVAVRRPRPAATAWPIAIPPRRPERWRLGGAVAAVLLLTLVAAALFRSHGGVPSGGTLVPGVGTLAEFPLPVAGRRPRLIVAGPDGNLWFTENGHLGRITPSGAITEFPLPGGAEVGGLAAGPDGNLWFTDVAAGRIGRLSLRGGAVMEFAQPTGSAPTGAIVAGPDSALWFLMGVGQSSGGPGPNFGKSVAIGRITPRGVVTEFALPLPGSYLLLRSLTVGPDGNLWFPITGAGYDAIGRMSPSGAVTWFPVSFNGEPSGLTVGPDGNLWFTLWEGNQVEVGRITPRGIITEFALPNGASPLDLTVGPDGNLWFIDGDRLGRITPAGRITEFAHLPAGMALDALITGPDGDLWGIDTLANRLVRIELARPG